MLNPTEIQSLMGQLGMNRTTELAVRCGVTDDAVRKWLRGERKPSGAALVLLHQLVAEAGLSRPRKELVTTE